jgi:hypothetical protein
LRRPRVLCPGDGGRARNGLLEESSAIHGRWIAA